MGSNPFNPVETPETLRMKQAFEEQQEGRSGALDQFKLENPLAGSEEWKGGGLSDFALKTPDILSDSGGLSSMGPGGEQQEEAPGGSEQGSAGTSPLGGWQGESGWKGALWGGMMGANMAGGTDAADLYKNQLRDTQVAQMQRRQQAWEDSYAMAQQLPPEVLTDPQYADLAAAAQAFQKDMMDGKVDNEKTLSNFQTQMALHRRDLENLTQTQDATQQLELESQMQSQQLQMALEAEKAGTATGQQKELLYQNSRYQRDDAGNMYDVERQEDMALRDREMADREARSQQQAQEHADRMQRMDQQHAQAMAQVEAAAARGDAFNSLRYGVGAIAEASDMRASLAEREAREECGADAACVERMINEARENSFHLDREKIMRTGLANNLVKLEDGMAIVAGQEAPLAYPPEEAVAELQQKLEEAKKALVDLGGISLEGDPSAPAGQPGNWAGQGPTPPTQDPSAFKAHMSGFMPEGGLVENMARGADPKAQAARQLEAVIFGIENQKRDLINKQNRVHEAVAIAGQRQLQMLSGR